MGGEQAANVLSQVSRDAHAAKGETLSALEDDKNNLAIRQQYERQGHPYYASARLWDDGIIMPKFMRAYIQYTKDSGHVFPVDYKIND